jgi:hypothetical protein
MCVDIKTNGHVIDYFCCFTFCFSSHSLSLPNPFCLWINTRLFFTPYSICKWHQTKSAFMKRGKSLPLFSSLVYHLPTFASLPRFRCSEQSVNIKAKGGRVCGRVKNWYSKSETFFYLRPHAGQQVKKKPASLFLAYHSFFPFLHKNVFFTSEGLTIGNK